MERVHKKADRVKNQLAVANAQSQRVSSNGAIFQFSDHRPEAVAQRKMQEVANKSGLTGGPYRSVSAKSSLAARSNNLPEGITQLMSKQSPKEIEIETAKTTTKEKFYLAHLLGEIETKYAEKEEDTVAEVNAPAPVRQPIPINEQPRIRRAALEAAGGKQAGGVGTLFVFDFSSNFHISIELEDYSFHITREVEGNPKAYWSINGGYTGNDPEVVSAISRAKSILDHAKSKENLFVERYYHDQERKRLQLAAVEAGKESQGKVEELRLKLQLGKGKYLSELHTAVERGWNVGNIGLAIDKLSEGKKKPSTEDIIQLYPARRRAAGNQPLPREASGNAPVSGAPTIQRKANKTGLPDKLKSGIENLSGFAMDDVRVHRNSAKPAQLQAHAYAQGTDIHLGPGQEKHLPHEAWHVVQQKQGRVKPTMQMKGKVNINDDAGLEREADLMGAKSLRQSIGVRQNKSFPPQSKPVAQRVGEETVGGFEAGSIEAGGGILELISDTYAAFGVYKSGGSKLEKASAYGKAAGSGVACLVTGLKAAEIEKGTSCLESLSEGLKIIDAGKEVGEAWGKINFSGDTYRQTFENLGGVILKVGDVLQGGMKIANAFAEAMKWLAGKIQEFGAWAPLSELILKGVKFLSVIKQYFNIYVRFSKLKELLLGAKSEKNKKALNYLIDEQWSRLKNGLVPVAAAFSDFAADASKYFPAMEINLAWSATLGTASKAAPLLHGAGTGVYDFARGHWRNLMKKGPELVHFLAAVDKADLPSFQKEIADYVMSEKNGAHSKIILGAIGLDERMDGMNRTKVNEAIRDAVKKIK